MTARIRWRTSTRRMLPCAAPSASSASQSRMPPRTSSSRMPAQTVGVPIEDLLQQQPVQEGRFVEHLDQHMDAVAQPFLDRAGPSDDGALALAQLARRGFRRRRQQGSGVAEIVADQRRVDAGRAGDRGPRQLRRRSRAQHLARRRDQSLAGDASILLLGSALGSLHERPGLGRLAGARRAGTAGETGLSSMPLGYRQPIPFSKRRGLEAIAASRRSRGSAAP